MYNQAPTLPVITLFRAQLAFLVRDQEEHKTKSSFAHIVEIQVQKMRNDNKKKGNEYRHSLVI